MKKTLHYPEGFQEQVNTLLERLSRQGVKLISPKSGQPSESALFRWLVEKELKTVAPMECPKCGEEEYERTESGWRCLWCKHEW